VSNCKHGDDAICYSCIRQTEYKEGFIINIYVIHGGKMKFTN